MPPKIDAIYSEIVFAVSRLIFGNSQGSLTIVQGIIRRALDAFNLKQRISEILDE